MNTAWYSPTPLSACRSPYPELDNPEDEAGMMASMKYLAALIDELVAQGVPERRIVVGGFSQGCAITLLIGLVSKYAGRLGGLVGLSGYLPLADRISTLREESGLARRVEQVEMFLARGTQDLLVPKRYFRITTERLLELGVEEGKMTLKEYEGMGHVMNGPELRDICEWLERVVLSLE
jgi:lysophospholipase I